MERVDHGYGRTGLDRENAPDAKEILMVPPQSLDNFQQQAVNVASAGSNVEIATNCKEEMLRAVGKTAPEQAKPQRGEDRKPEQAAEKSKEIDRSEQKPKQQERRQDMQREMTSDDVRRTGVVLNYPSISLPGRCQAQPASAGFFDYSI